MQALKRLAAIGLLALMGCVSQAPAPENPSEVIATVATEIATTAHAVRDAQLSGLISAQKAQDLKEQLSAARHQVVLAEGAFLAGQGAEGDDRIETVHLILAFIIEALKSVEAQHGTR